MAAVRRPFDGTGNWRPPFPAPTELMAWPASKAEHLVLEHTAAFVRAEGEVAVQALKKGHLNRLPFLSDTNPLHPYYQWLLREPLLTIKRLCPQLLPKGWHLIQRPSFQLEACASNASSEDQGPVGKSDNAAAATVLQTRSSIHVFNESKSCSEVTRAASTPNETTIAASFTSAPESQVFKNEGESKQKQGVLANPPISGKASDCEAKVNATGIGCTISSHNTLQSAPVAASGNTDKWTQTDVHPSHIDIETDDNACCSGVSGCRTSADYFRNGAGD